MNDTIEKSDKKKTKYEHSKLVMASYGTRELFGQWVTSAFGFTVFFFYENVIQLSTWLAMWGFIIFSIWNAINDPLMGWIMERIHPPWEDKNLRRFPWIVIGVIPWLFSYLLIFLVPGNWYGTPSLVQENQWLIFIWYAGTLCLYDSTLTIYEVNVISLYPDKFRDLNERRTTQLFGTILGITGLVLAAIIPPMIIGETLVPSGYINASIVTVGIGFILFLLILPGVYEGKKTKRLYKRREEFGQTREVEPFIKSTTKVVNDKTFMLKILHFFGYQVGGVMIQTSALYITTYILGMGAEGTTLLLGSMLIGALISVPIWGIVANKINNNRKIGIIGGFTLFLGFIPLIFVTSLAGWMISLVFFGVGIGANWYIDPPLMGDVLDDISVRTGKSQHAIYYGIQSFFVKFGQTFIAVTIALSHIFTGYVQGAETQTPRAIFGIRIHTAIVPAILMLITITLFYKYYKLTPDKVAINKKKLKEMGI